MIKIQNLNHPHLQITNWQVEKFESWCVLGKNGSGKQYLDKLLVGELGQEDIETIKLPIPEKVKLVSFEAQQAIYEHELKIDETDITNEIDLGTPVREFLPEGTHNHPLVEKLQLTHKLDTGYRQLSTGESRKLLILQSILNGAELLICDNPFDSLDTNSCINLSQTLNTISQQGIAVLLLLSNRQDIPDWCTHIALIDEGNFEILGTPQALLTKQRLDQLLSLDDLEQRHWPERPFELSDYQHSYLAKLTNCTVSYDFKPVFKDLNVAIEPLQHTLITGANGSGKSTLMQLITGDCPQCFSNDVTVLGYKRGNGESIWDIKKHMGIVSSELHRQYRVKCNALTVVASGFTDSIGLYQEVDGYKARIARQWLAMVDMAEHANTQFQQLSYGEQRLILIARALVKSPLLLILDEPTQGLDEVNRQRILTFLQKIELQQHSTILLVSHRIDEQLSIFKQHIKM